MNSSVQILVKRPDLCSNQEILDFLHLVTLAGEVSLNNINARVLSARSLVFLREGEKVQGIIAIKCPSLGYRKYVLSQAAIDLSCQSLPFELGWLYVSPCARGKTYAIKLIDAALSSINDEGIFATSHRKNMVFTLSKFGFQQMGKSYKSSCGTHTLNLFIRSPSQSI